jgi:tight adherence protein B
MELGDPRTALLLVAVTSVIGLAGLWVYLSAWAQQGSMKQRSALEIAERRAGRMRNRLDLRFRRTWIGHEIGVRLTAAGVPLNTVEFLALCTVAAIAGYILTDTIAPPWLAVVGALIGVRLCWAWVERQRTKRKLEFIQQLPELARILSNASSAGLAVTTAIDMAAHELDEPGKSEMDMVAEELRLGQSLERSLANLEHRMPSREVGVLISTLVIQQRSGGDLVRALQEMALTLDQRRDLNREIRTLMAGSIFTGRLVAILGVGSVVMMNAFNPGAIDELSSEPLGQLALLATGLLYLIGFLLVKRVTRIDV